MHLPHRLRHDTHDGVQLWNPAAFGAMQGEVSVSSWFEPHGLLCAVS